MAKFVTRNYVYETGSMTGILGQLKWESLKKRRKDNRLILLYKGLKGKAKIPTDDLIPKINVRILVSDTGTLPRQGLEMMNHHYQPLPEIYQFSAI